MFHFVAGLVTKALDPTLAADAAAAVWLSPSAGGSKFSPLPLTLLPFSGFSPPLLSSPLPSTNEGIDFFSLLLLLQRIFGFFYVCFFSLPQRDVLAFPPSDSNCLFRSNPVELILIQSETAESDRPRPSPLPGCV